MPAAVTTAMYTDQPVEKKSLAEVLAGVQKEAPPVFADGSSPHQPPVPSELRWYGESLLAFRSIPLAPIEPLFRVYHHDWHFNALRRLGNKAVPALIEAERHPAQRQPGRSIRPPPVAVRRPPPGRAVRL